MCFCELAFPPAKGVTPVLSTLKVRTSDKNVCDEPRGTLFQFSAQSQTHSWGLTYDGRGWRAEEADGDKPGTNGSPHTHTRVCVCPQF